MNEFELPDLRPASKEDNASRALYDDASVAPPEYGKNPVNQGDASDQADDAVQIADFMRKRDETASCEAIKKHFSKQPDTAAMKQLAERVNENLEGTAMTVKVIPFREGKSNAVLIQGLKAADLEVVVGLGKKPRR